MPKNRQASRTPVQIAHALYGPDFGFNDSKGYEAAMRRWATMPEAERSFTTAHLLYLGLLQGAVSEARAAKRAEALLEFGGEVADGLGAIGHVLEHIGVHDDDDDEDDDEPPVPGLDEITAAAVAESLDDDDTEELQLDDGEEA